MGICVRAKDPNNPGNLEERLVSRLPAAPGASEQYPMGLQWYISP